MNTELFIARRILFDYRKEKRISRPIVSIAIASIALGVSVMILSVAIVTGFRSEIIQKVIGFGSHIQVINYDTNVSYETKPVLKTPELFSALDSLKGVRHVQEFAIKAGIIKAGREIQGIVLKGIGKDFDWSFFNKSLVEGKPFILPDTIASDKIILSKNIASLLNLKTGDKIITYFVQDPPRFRRFTIGGIYKTSLEKFDNMIVLVDIRHIQKLNDWTENQVSGFELDIENFNNIDEMVDNVNDIVGYTFSAEGDKLKVRSVKEKDPEIFDWLNLINMNVWVILILMIVVAGFNMVSGFLILILERAGMIGLLKALGTTNRSIRKIFLYDAAILIIRGLFWGNLLGIGLCLIQDYFKIIPLDPSSYYVDTVPVNLNFWYIFFLNAGTLGIILLSMLIPSYVISRIDPVKVLRFN